IVCTPDDAYRCFMASEMDMLVLGNAILHKSEQLPPLPAHRPPGDDLVPARLLQCLKPPSAANDAALERGNGEFRCARTGTLFPDRDGVPSLFSDAAEDGAGRVRRAVKAFYEEHPFPNYDGLQDFGDLVNRGLKNSFAKALLDAIGYNKLILECGCGTGQMSHFLSLNNNHVLGVDLSLSSLKLAI